MKTLFIKAERKIDVDMELNINNLNRDIENLPKEIFIAYSIQYKKLAEKIKEKLEKSGKKVRGFKQVLGCSELKSKSPILLVSSGKFHAVNLILQDNSVFLLERDKIRKIEDKEIIIIKNRRKAALSKFLAADNLGIIVSCKPGQENLQEALKIKKTLVEKGKKAYIFAANNISINDLENYNIDSWLNTACPGLALDSLDNHILNTKELKIRK